MGVSTQPIPDADAFARFVANVRPALLQALVATYGPVDGREATVDALSWAWEHWDRVVEMDHWGTLFSRTVDGRPPEPPQGTREITRARADLSRRRARKTP